MSSTETDKNENSSLGTADASKAPVQDETDEIEIVNKQNDNPELNTLLLLNTVYYVIVFILFGLPIWYFTTTTYRASLPFDEIYEIVTMNKIEYKANINLIHLSGEMPKTNLDKKLAEELNKDLSLSQQFKFKCEAKISKANTKELELVNSLSSIEELDDAFKNQNLNELKIFVLGINQANKFGLIGEHQFVFRNNLFVHENVLTDVSKVANYLKANYLYSKQLTDAYNKKQDIERKIPTKQELKVLNFDSEYEIIFTLINEDPEKFKSNWNIDYCVENFFQKITDQLNIYTNFSLKAQVLLYTDFASYPLIKNSDADGNVFYFIKPSDLPVMTNNIESRLGSRISDSSALEFVTYVSAKQPLYIMPDSQSTQKTRSFLVPRWGGIYIFNYPDEKNPNIIQVDEAMKVFMTQFIDLIGIDLKKNTRDDLKRSGIYQSEIYGYLLKKTLENQLNSINTLKSLSSLLTKISSMVIEDDIAEQVKLSVNALKKSIRLASEGIIDQSFYESKQAFLSSEKAFFDPSLLEKLYFPEDQRFAIYIPLFIPVGIPVLLSFKSLISWFKAKRAASAKKPKTE